MKKSMFVVVIFILTTVVYAQDVSYSIMLEYNRGELFLLRLRLVDQETPILKTQVEEGYLLETTAYNGSILHKQRFTIPLKVFTDTFDEGGKPIVPGAGEQTAQNTTVATVILLTPYYREATKINIYDQGGRRLLIIDTTPYADYCGDKKCSSAENSASCPQDCKTTATVIKTTTTLVSRATATTIPKTTTTLKETACGNGACEAGETESGCPQDCGSKTSPLAYAAAAIAILVIIALVVSKTKKKSV